MDKYSGELITDIHKYDQYRVGHCLGKGSFGTCFRVTNLKTNRVYACKKISKRFLEEKDSLDKLQTEIQIHRSLKHQHVVIYCDSFDDRDNHYILLELCGQGSMSDLIYRRKYLTNPEVRYYMMQVLSGVQYLHDSCIIHRDLKLGNLLLTDLMTVKIGDFGLAANVTGPSYKRYSVCGTPNYIAPEIIDGLGHSFKVDVWAIGCIIYTLLMGRPPFVAKDRESTFDNVCNCRYPLNSKLNAEVRDLLEKIFQYDAVCRPSVYDLTKESYFEKGYTPATLPVSALNRRPTFYEEIKSNTSSLRRTALKDTTNLQKVTENISADRSKRKLSDNKLIVKNDFEKVRNVQVSDCDKENLNRESSKKLPVVCCEFSTEVQELLSTKAQAFSSVNVLSPLPPNGLYSNSQRFATSCCICTSYFYLRMIIDSIEGILNASTSVMHETNFTNIINVSRWASHSSEYGSEFAYNISDNSLGVAFSDLSYLILMSNQSYCWYILPNGAKTSFIIHTFPPILKEKMKALCFFKRLMNDLKWCGLLLEGSEGDPVFVVDWRRYDEDCVVMFLSSGIFQVNFLKEHVKIVLNEPDKIISRISEEDIKTYSTEALKIHGCSSDFKVELNYVLQKAVEMYQCRSHGLKSHK